MALVLAQSESGLAVGDLALGAAGLLALAGVVVAAVMRRKR